MVGVDELDRDEQGDAGLLAEAQEIHMGRQVLDHVALHARGRSRALSAPSTLTFNSVDRNLPAFNCLSRVLNLMLIVCGAVPPP